MLLALSIWVALLLMPKEKEKTEERRIKVSLKELPPKPKEIPKEEIQQEIKQEIPKETPPPVAPPMPKGSQLKELIKLDPKELAKPKKEPKKEIKKVEPKPSPKIEPLPPQKPYIELEKPQEREVKEQKKSEAYSFLAEDLSSSKEPKKSEQSHTPSHISSNLRELYGDEFGLLPSEAQKYLIDNQEIMRRITQEVLNRVASVNLTPDLTQSSYNIIEFYLHPNGDISEIKFLKPSGQFILDRTTKETIEYAYSRYPRPEVKTLVRYNVYYNLARY